MSTKRYETGIELKDGSRKIIFRDAREIKGTAHKLTFLTAVTCLGNNTIDGRRVFTEFMPETISGIEHLVPNSIMIRYEKVDRYTTKVIVYIDEFESFELIKGY